jgi:5-formyltetrahydrofolate cyclo-ligase
MTDHAEVKRLLRKEKIAAREALPEEDRVRFSADICRRIEGTREYQAAKVIFVYKWVKGEVRLDRLERTAMADGKRLVYPLCVSKTEMVAIEAGPEEDAWKAGFMNIMEPDPDKGTLVDPADIDLVIAPCSSFDERCRRLGMGGGFYDRYLPKCANADIIAVAYEAQRADEVPVDEHDRSVDMVITEQRIITVNE